MVYIKSHFSEITDLTHQQVDDWLEPIEQFTKWRWQVKHHQRIGEMVRRALKVAATPPGGPVYIRFPFNVLSKHNVKDKIYPKQRFTVPVAVSFVLVF